MSSCFRWRAVFTSPVRMAGPCVSRRIATDRRASSASARMRGTTSRTERCSAWLMFNRQMSVPFSINCRNTSAFSDAGPRVQMILVLRIDQRIEPGVAKARRFSHGHGEKPARAKQTRHAVQTCRAGKLRCLDYLAVFIAFWTMARCSLSIGSVFAAHDFRSRSSPLFACFSKSAMSLLWSASSSFK